MKSNSSVNNSEREISQPGHSCFFFVRLQYRECYIFRDEKRLPARYPADQSVAQVQERHECSSCNCKLSWYSHRQLHDSDWFEPAHPTLHTEPTHPTLQTEPAHPAVQREPAHPTLRREPAHPTLRRGPAHPTLQRALSVIRQ